jgi:hypothetical protein
VEDISVSGGSSMKMRKRKKFKFKKYTWQEVPIKLLTNLPGLFGGGSVRVRIYE